MDRSPTEYGGPGPLLPTLASAPNAIRNATHYSFLHFKVPKALIFFSDIERPNHLGFSLEIVSGQVDLDAGLPRAVPGCEKVGTSRRVFSRSSYNSKIS